MRINNTTKFSGCSDENWEKWIFRFEIRFGETDEQKLASILLDVLDGAALDVCGKLSKDDRKNYKSLTETLQKKFGTSVDARRANAELRQIRQLPGENTEAFADRVQKLTNIANPGLSSEQLDHTALEHFLCGLCDLKLQERLHNNDAVISIKKALEVAQRLQNKEQTLTAMRTATGEDTVAAIAANKASANETPQDREGDQIGEILAMVGELRKDLNDMKIKTSRDQRSNTPNRSNRGACYQCGDTAHFKRECPQLNDRRQQGQQFFVPRAVPDTGHPGTQCLGCGRRGHVVARCWRTPVVAGGAGSSSTPRNMAGKMCLNCGKQGHWAADCWQETSIKGLQTSVETQQLTHQGNCQ